MSLASLPRQIGRYDVVESLGRGSMGQVWLARDPVLSRHVAIKVVRNDLELDGKDLLSLKLRIRQEAQAAAQVSHQGIVALFDLGTDEEHGDFIVSESVSGPTLQQALEKGRLTREGVARLARVLGEALSKAHELGVIHRDIKPSNIILTSEGPKLTDFGIARLPESVLTKAGAKLGTPAYSAPEVIDSAEQSAASDQFAFAATLYEALSGKRAFPGATAVDVARSVHRLKLTPLARELGLPQELDDILFKAMARDPSARFADSHEFGTALSNLISDGRETLHTLPELSNHEVLSPRPPKGHVVGYIALIFLLGAICALLLNSLQTTTPSEFKTIETEKVPVIHLGVWKSKE